LPNKRIDVVYFDAASGHRSAAVAVVRALRERLPDHEARAVNLVDLLRPHWPLRLITRSTIFYINDMIAHERVRDLGKLMRACIALCTRLSPRDRARIGRLWPDGAPAAVVSVTPMYNDVLSRGLQRVRPSAPYRCHTIGSIRPATSVTWWAASP
jgi:hypothetical protein